MQKSTLHVKVKPELAKGLKSLARKLETSVGELIRQALESNKPMPVVWRVFSQMEDLETWNILITVYLIPIAIFIFHLFPSGL